MSEPDRNLQRIEEGMRAFEGALAAGGTALPEVRCVRLLAVTDGSNQTAAVASVLGDLARALPELAGTDLLGLDVRPLEDALPPAAPRRRVRESRPLAVEDAHRTILEAAREGHADVVVLPTPCCVDWAELGDDSLGPTTDLLLERLHLPLLCVRDPARRDALARAVLWAEASDDASLRAAAWAARLARGALVVLVAAAAAEREGLLHLAGLRFALDDESVAAALALGTAPLVGAVHRASRAGGADARVRVAVEPLEALLPDEDRTPGLHVVPAGPLARQVLLHAANPVLVVP